MEIETPKLEMSLEKFKSILNSGLLSDEQGNITLEKILVFIEPFVPEKYKAIFNLIKLLVLTGKAPESKVNEVLPE